MLETFVTAQYDLGVIRIHNNEHTLFTAPKSTSEWADHFWNNYLFYYCDAPNWEALVDSVKLWKKDGSMDQKLAAEIKSILREKFVYMNNLSTDERIQKCVEIAKKSFQAFQKVEKLVV